MKQLFEQYGLCVPDEHYQCYLAHQYETGDGVVKQDRVTAFVLYFIAAQKGNPQAEEHLELLAVSLSPQETQEAQRILHSLEHRLTQLSAHKN